MSAVLAKKAFAKKVINLADIEELNQRRSQGLACPYKDIMLARKVLAALLAHVQLNLTCPSLEPWQVNYQQPFAIDTMHFEQWLRYFYLPVAIGMALDGDLAFFKNIEAMPFVYEQVLQGRTIGDEYQPASQANGTVDKGQLAWNAQAQANAKKLHASLTMLHKWLEQIDYDRKSASTFTSGWITNGTIVPFAVDDEIYDVDLANLDWVDLIASEAWKVLDLPEGQAINV